MSKRAQLWEEPGPRALPNCGYASRQSVRTTALGATWVSHSGSGALVRVPKARCAVRATGRGSPRTGGPLGGPAVHPIARYGVRVSRVFVSGTCLPWYRPRCQLSWRTTASCPKDNCSRRNSSTTWWAAWTALAESTHHCHGQSGHGRCLCSSLYVFPRPPLARERAGAGGRVFA